ncbi:hypothetical protein [Brevibacillus borstelensis]|uniref:hypothetical protein n=1 Tax=Brevibacillus borstelensis TaxID=45462 RepID=UPI0030BE26B5
MLDKQNGAYRLVFEEDWHVPKSHLIRPDELDDFVPYETFDHKNIFETIDYGGGTGLHEEVAHLWYLDNGKVVIAWEGTFKTESKFPGSELRNARYLPPG